MSWLVELQNKIQDAEVELVKLDRAIADDPNSWSLRAMAESLKKLQQSLFQEFEHEAALVGVDICSYRLIPTAGNLPMKAVSEAFLYFQSLISNVFASIRSGPRSTSRIGEDTELATTMNFAYTFAGSLGVVMTIPNERLILVESDLDKAFKTVFALAKAETSDDVRVLADKLGLSPIRILYNWSSSLAKSELSADVNWQRGSQVRANLQIQVPELEKLSALIAATSEEQVTEGIVEGVLLAADVKRRTFRMSLDVGGEITGTFEDAISEHHSAQVPKRYSAQITKTTKTNYSTGVERSKYHLVELIEVE